MVQTTGDILTDAIVADPMARGVWIILVAQSTTSMSGWREPLKARCRKQCRQLRKALDFVVRCPGQPFAALAIAIAPHDAHAERRRRMRIPRIGGLERDRFGADPETVLWGHVGTLEHWNSRLREAADAYFKRGEFAK